MNDLDFCLEVVSR